MIVGGVQRRWLSRDVGSELWGQRVHVGDAVPCCSLLDSLGREEVGEEVDGIDVFIPPPQLLAKITPCRI